MSRQSISFTEPNDEWLKAQVNKNEYSSKSELVNDLIRQARKQQISKDIIVSENSILSNLDINELQFLLA